MSRKQLHWWAPTVLSVAILLVVAATTFSGPPRASRRVGAAGAAASAPQKGNDAGMLVRGSRHAPDRLVEDNAEDMVDSGRRIFRFDTFGDQQFWGNTLKLHQALTMVSPVAALGMGLKVDAGALPQSLIKEMRRGRVNLNDPAVTLELLRLNAVVGVTGFFQGKTLTSVGIQCALCHSTVDDSLAFGIGHRLDGWANRDLDVGSIIAAAPDLSALVNALSVVHPGITDSDVRMVLKSWGPGKFDAELLLDGKAFNPSAPATVLNHSAATLIPNAFGLAGFNLHTWTGGWGTVTYWNAFVATVEMGGIGTFFDARFDNAAQFPIAAAKGFGHLRTDPDSDLITSKLPALQFYQLAIPAPRPRAGIDFDPVAAKRGDDLFGDKAKCVNCHVEPLWTEPGWNAHPAGDINIESFQADRSPDHSYKTMNLAGIFIREEGIHMAPANKGRFYHDGRFPTLLDVVQSYNVRLNLGLSPQEMSDIVEYLKSL